MPEEPVVETPAAPAVSEEKKALEEKSNGKEAVVEAKSKKTKVATPSAPSVHKKNYEKDVVYVYQFNRIHSLPSPSPFCLRLETWLKMHNVKFENVAHNNKLRSKRGLLPFVELNGEEIADSELIMQTLGKKFEKNMDEGLTKEQQGVHHAMAAMVDNHLHWVIMQWFVRDFNNFSKGLNVNLQQFLNSKLPLPILNMVLKHVHYKKEVKQVRAAGFGCYTNDECDEMGRQDLKVLSDLLGDQDYFFGSEPRMLDLKAFSSIAFILNTEDAVEWKLKDYIKEQTPNLQALYNRIKERVWGEHWDEASGESLDLNPHMPKPEPKEEEKKEEKEEKKDEDKEEKEEKEEKKEDNEEKKEEENK